MARFFDTHTGNFTYYGDNKKPGNELHETSKKGNIILRETFSRLHTKQRRQIPPFFVFEKGTIGRDVIFKGLAVPGSKFIDSDEDLVVVWKEREGLGYQNYKAIFTILDVPIISRKWLKDLRKEDPLSSNAHKLWTKWYHTGYYFPRIENKDEKYKEKEEQIPSNSTDVAILEEIFKHFQNEDSFKQFAVELIKLMDSNIIQCSIEEDFYGDKDVVGKYKVGVNEHALFLNFSMETKLFPLNKAVKLKDLAQLILKLQGKQFGIMLTTSFVEPEAYKQIISSKYPILILTGRDIVDILKRTGLTTKVKMKKWLNSLL